MELNQKMKDGHPQYRREIMAYALSHGNIEPLKPLLNKVLRAKRRDERPSETEDSSLFWSWNEWVLTYRGSGKGGAIHTLSLKIYNETERVTCSVPIACKFEGDDCNTPFDWRYVI